MDPKIYNAASNKNSSSTDFASLKSDSGLQITCGKGNTILHVAVSSGSEQSVAHILNLHRDLAFETNKDGDTALHVAARLGDLRIVTLLVSHFELPGALEAAIYPFRALNAKKSTALHEAVKKGHADIAELLLQKDEHSASLRNEAGESPLFLAMDRGNYDTACSIFERWPVCSLFGRNGMTVAHAATLRFQDAFLGKILEKCGSEILVIPDNFGWMPLHHAASIGNIFAVQLFLEKTSALACIKDSEGMTALHIAARHGHCRTMSKLIEGRPDACELVDSRGRTALHVAVESGETGIVSLLLRTKAFVDLIDEQDRDGNTSLHIAATKCGYRSLGVLLGSDKRIDKGVINGKGMSALDIVLENEKLSALGKARIAALFNNSVAHRSLQQSNMSERKEKYKVEKKDKYKVSQSQATQESDDSSTQMSKTDELENDNIELSEKGANAGIFGNMRDMKPFFSYLKDASTINLVIATIIVSATYAAAIQVPGGYNSEGMPNLKSRPEFKYFMLYNSVAFGSAVGSMITYFIDELFPKYKVERKIMTTPDVIRFSSIFLSMMLTFFSAIFLVGSYQYATRAIWYSDSHDLKFNLASILGFDFERGKSYMKLGLPGSTAYILFLFPLLFFFVSLYTQGISYIRILRLSRRRKA